MCSCGFVKFLVVNVAPMFSPAGSQLPSLGLPDVLEVAVVLGAAHDVEAVVALARDGGVDGDHTASPKVLKIFSHPQTRDQSQVVQNDKLSQESVETKIFVGGNGTFSHF